MLGLTGAGPAATWGLAGEVQVPGRGWPAILAARSMRRTSGCWRLARFSSHRPFEPTDDIGTR